jgi:signal peptidase I
VRKVIDWVITLVVAIGFVLIFEAEVAKPFRVPSGSMEPTLRCARPGTDCTARFNDRVIANRLAYRYGSPKRGQVVVFNSPKDACGIGGVFVKRLIGLPGDVVSESHGDVYVNGVALKEPYIEPKLRDDESHTWPRVPKGHYFFMGDDRANSCDSRVWGTVARSSLIGPVMFVYWPPNRWF